MLSIMYGWVVQRLNVRAMIRGRHFFFFLSWRYDLAYMGCGVILWAGPTWRIGSEHCIYYSHEANR